MRRARQERQGEWVDDAADIAEQCLVDDENATSERHGPSGAERDQKFANLFRNASALALPSRIRSCRRGVGASFAVAIALCGPGAAVVSAEELPSSLVNTIETWRWSPSSPDPAGLAYNPADGRLIVTDSEVNEMSIYSGANYYEATLGGSLLRTSNTLMFSKEPTGVALGVGELFMTNDDQDRVQQIQLGANGQFDAFDTYRYFSTTQYGSYDPEGVAYDPVGNRLFIADGSGSEIFQISPVDGVFGNGNDHVQHFDTYVLGVKDPETVEFNSDTGTLFTVSTGGKKVLELTTAGMVLSSIDISYLTGIAPAGMTWAPRSTDPSQKSLYIADRAVDNNVDPTENDGKIYEIAIGATAPPPTAPAPTASYTFSPTSPEVGQAVNFDGSGSGCAATPCSYRWEDGTQAIGTGTTLTHSFSTAGEHPVKLTVTDAQSRSDSTTKTITVSQPPTEEPEDKALNKPASASSIFSKGYTPEKGNDGDSSTRWMSARKDNEWWQADLGALRKIDSVELNWSEDYAKTYKIQISTDGTTFTDVASVTLSAATLQRSTFPTVDARYVRVLGLTRATKKGFSFWDARVFGPADT